MTNCSGLNCVPSKICMCKSKLQPPEQRNKVYLFKCSVAFVTAAQADSYTDHPSLQEVRTFSFKTGMVLGKPGISRDVGQMGKSWPYPSCWAEGSWFSLTSSWRPLSVLCWSWAGVPPQLYPGASQRVTCFAKASMEPRVLGTLQERCECQQTGWWGPPKSVSATFAVQICL